MPLVLAIVLFTVCSGISFYHHQRATRLVSVALPLAVWQINLLEQDYGRFIRSLELYGLEATSHAQLQQDFDILWSRLDVVLHSDETDEVRIMPPALEVASRLSATVQAMDSLIQRLPPGRGDDFQQVWQALSGFTVELRRLQMQIFSERHRAYDLGGALTYLQNMQVFLFGLLLSGLLLVALLFREARRRLQQAEYDALTELPNRLSFVKQLDDRVRQAKASGQGLAVHMLDLLEFSEINDSLGHSAGDQALQAVAARLKTCLRDGEQLARIGGDEFAVLQYPANGRDEATSLVRRLVAAVQAPFECSEGRAQLSPCVGTSLFPADSEQQRQLMVYADMALHQAKQRDKRPHQFYEQQIYEDKQRRKRLAGDLKALLQSDPGTQLEVHYQPIIDLHDGGNYVESLVRWRHPDKGFIPPKVLIDIAEQHGLGQALGLWIIDTACADLRRLIDMGSPLPRTAVNISPSMYLSGSLAEDIVQILERHRLSPSQLVVEVTEDTTLRDMGSDAVILRQLTALGVNIALDDFGTGTSSLSHLIDMPVQILKIDRSFILAWREARSDLSMIRSIIDLGHRLNLKVVAEGIETAEELALLHEQGCDFVQGYYFSRPLPFEALHHFLQTKACHLTE